MRTNKNTDHAIKELRDIRDQLNRKFENMSLEEEKKYIQKHLASPISQDDGTKFTELFIR